MLQFCPESISGTFRTIFSSCVDANGNGSAGFKLVNTRGTSDLSLHTINTRTHRLLQVCSDTLRDLYSLDTPQETQHGHHWSASFASKNIRSQSLCLTHY